MAVEVQTQKHDVGGVLLDRPFKIRRLGHFGFNVANFDESVRFYNELLGFRKSDTLAGPKGLFGVFMRHGGDHHSLLIERRHEGPRPVPPHHTARPEGDGAGYEDVTINQITWQVGSLQEVVNASKWLPEQGVTLRNLGRGMPGFNYHAYFFSPEGHVDEMYYGIEQIGWNGESRPERMYTHERHFRYAPDLPQIPEGEEMHQLLEHGIDIHGGPSDLERAGSYEVDGVMLQRPFRIVRIGPVRLFAKHLDVATRFYRDTLGFAVTEEVTYQGQRCVFLRNNTEHHSLALYPLELRAELGFRQDSSCMSFGVQLATYRQLKHAVAFLKEHGCTVRELPAELFPGVGHSAFVLDPDGNAIQLYSYMEQIGWDGKPRPAGDRPHLSQGQWPDTVPGEPDAYEGEVFLGPLG